MLSSTTILLSLIISVSVVQAVGLIEALQNAGASEYAQFIQSDPSIAALYASSNVQTVFAPIDGSVLPSLPSRKRQANPTSERQAEYQGMRNINRLGASSVPPGAILPSNDNSANTGGQSQVAVTNPSNATQSPSEKRWLANIKRANGTYPSLLKVYTGLGNYVNIIKADIPYDGGLIQIVDNYFTLPQSLSSTASANGHTSFLSAANSTNATSILDNTPSITAFIPSNAAFSNRTAATSYASSSNLLSGHIIPNFLGYLPALTNGATYQTQAGGNITITIRGGQYFVNNAKIIASNQILENGVAHIIDSIIIPSTPHVSFNGATSFTGGFSSGFVLVGSLALSFAAALFFRV
ncbi:hypothetical protein B7463_g11949, partial [Scytalidium lignicola]